MKFNQIYKIFLICFFITFCFICTCVYADITESVADKIRQGKVNAQRMHQELSDEINHIHEGMGGRTASTQNPTSVSSRRAVENMDFIQLLRNSVPVITGLNSARLMNAAQDTSLSDAISLIEDDAVRSSFESRLGKLSSAREKHNQDAEKAITTLSDQMMEIDPDFPSLTLWVSSEQLYIWVNEFERYVKNNPYSVQSHSYVSVQNSLAELKKVRTWMNSLGEELDALEKELVDL
ncbi:MAG: hypothetical protein LBV40_04715 [Methanomicrobiales archaeon]|jgi:hypothetical protein|nr:hypothetical protein [Methanomicrobiales archaeon]